MTAWDKDGTAIGSRNRQMVVATPAEISGAFKRMILGVVEPDFTDSVKALIRIICADGREFGRLDRVMTEFVKGQSAMRGEVISHRSISIAGSFMTPVDTIPEVKNAIHDMLFHYAIFKDMHPDDFQLVVQIHTHGDVMLKDAEHEDPYRRVYDPKELEIRKDGSCINCGMRGAGKVWKELIEEITGDGPLVSYFDKKTSATVLSTINSEAAFLLLLREVYGYQDEQLESFVSSISNLITHPSKQKEILKEALRNDRRLGNVKITTNAAINNYEEGAVFRVDGNMKVHTFFDDIAILRRLIYLDRDILPDDDPERLNRIRDQRHTAKAGIICHDSIRAPRTMLAKWLENRGMEINVAGGVFATAICNSAVHSHYPFSPYQIVAFYYAVSHLGIKDHYLVGNDEDQCTRINLKIKNDPIMQWIIKKYGVRLHLVTTEQMKTREKDEGDDRYRAMVAKAYLKMRDNLPENSVLRRNVKPQFKAVLGR